MNFIESAEKSDYGNESVAQDIELPAISQTFLNDKSAVHLCERYESSKSLILQGDAWPDAVADYVPFIDAYARDDDHETLAKGLLARLLELSYRSNSSENKSIEEFTLGVLDMLSQLRHVPDCLMRPRNGTHLKRQPSFFESMMGTIKRYKFMEALPVLFNGVADGIIIGGSMGYGPFFSVRDGKSTGDPSDIDAIIVMNDNYANAQNWQGVLASEVIQNSDKLSLFSRFAIFAAMRRSDTVDVISQRFDIPGQSFNVSAHFMDHTFFDRMVGDQLTTDLATQSDTVFVARDLKPKRFEHAVCAQRSFDGSVYEYTVPEQLKLDCGYLAEIPAYIVAKKKLYPGLYQNLISPEFDVLYDTNGLVTTAVDTFRKTVIGHIENVRSSGQNASLGLSHIRSEYFSPGRYDQRANMVTSDHYQSER